MSDAVRARLAESFAATVAAESERGRGRLAGERRLGLPPALRESIVAVADLDGGACPEPLRAFYCETMPRMLIDQIAPIALDSPSMDGGNAAARRLLHRRLEGATVRARLPRLNAALDGLHAALAAEGIDPRALTGAASPAELLAESPSPLDLHARMLFGSGLPMLGGYPAERAVLAADLARGEDVDAIVDRRLSGHVLHELCHGLAREVAPGPGGGAGQSPPWLLVEAAALQLGARAFPRHVFPDEEGEAVPGVSRFVLVGEALARVFGARAAWGLLLGRSTAECFGPRAGAALEAAAFQDYARRRAPPFVVDALRAFDWIKLALASGLAETGTRAPELTRLSELIQRVGLPNSEGIPVAAAGAAALPDLLDAAGAVPFGALPWPEDSDADRRFLDTGVRALFQVDRMAPHFSTAPSPAPGERLHVDAERCTIAAEPRSDGVLGEPACWLLPPPIARGLLERGVRRVVIEGARRERAAGIAARLADLAAGKGGLPVELRLDAAARAPRARGDVFSAAAEAGRRFLFDAARAAACALGVEAALEEPGDASAVAARIGVAPRRLRALLDVLVLDGAIHREGDRFRRSDRKLAAPSVPAAGWGRLAEVIRNDRPLPAEEIGSPEALARFHRHLAEAGAGAARELATRLAPLVGDGAFLDLGAGAGAYTGALLDAAPSSTATVIDRPEVIGLARAALARHGERVRYLVADGIVDPLPPGARLAVLANLLHLHPPDACARLVGAAAAALSPGGTLVVKDLRVDPDRRGSPEGLLFSLNMALYTDGGAAHDVDAIAAWLRAAGLREVAIEPLESAPDAVVIHGCRPLR